ncbi:uncharacterized protein AMSG_06536 [Thecamonas trahens ATCC 50062]|uniref:C2 domain-containing protein n=1 Tax=Thecamonas trahens ATCC 50062 TaxID=461836 RepID=A0A0L0DG76_THETB|nr:hypothetical protein AMSG_06536 [Thecamonas trahens ATCC 50062]KNC51185.1 hypothetical protein AMSG_06536 [Thecamonas trahens ATCC 50062]|eukprot:XP_013756386.1 hypothetical protein AMSG_06536 [Thecamonas trahens ATCC 50062]
MGQVEVLVSAMEGRGILCPTGTAEQLEVVVTTESGQGHDDHHGQEDGQEDGQSRSALAAGFGSSRRRGNTPVWSAQLVVPADGAAGVTVALRAGKEIIGERSFTLADIKSRLSPTQYVWFYLTPPPASAHSVRTHDDGAVGHLKLRICLVERVEVTDKIRRVLAGSAADAETFSTAAADSAYDGGPIPRASSTTVFGAVDEQSFALHGAAAGTSDGPSADAPAAPAAAPAPPQYSARVQSAVDAIAGIEGALEQWKREKQGERVQQLQAHFANYSGTQTFVPPHAPPPAAYHSQAVLSSQARGGLADPRLPPSPQQVPSLQALNPTQRHVSNTLDTTLRRGPPTMAQPRLAGGPGMPPMWMPAGGPAPRPAAPARPRGETHLHYLQRLKEQPAAPMMMQPQTPGYGMAYGAPAVPFGPPRGGAW